MPVEASASMKIMASPESLPVRRAMREKLFHFTNVSFCSFWPLA